jgi:hypothetical protein
MSETKQEGTSQRLCNLLVLPEAQAPPAPATEPAPPKNCVDSFTLAERRDRKNLQTKYRAAARKSYAETISLKSEAQRTHEERDMLHLIETRRLRKNQRSRQRMKEEQTEVDRIFEKHEQDRTFHESDYMAKIRRRTARKNEGDRLRRLRQRLGDRDDLKLEPLVSLKQRVPIGSTPAAKVGKVRRCITRTDVTVETERNRTEVTAAGLCQSPTSWSIVQERVELLPFDLVQVPWRNETGDVVVPSYAPFVPQEEHHFKGAIHESITNTSASSDMLLLDTNRRTTPHPLHPLFLMQPALFPMLNHREQCSNSNPNSILFNSNNDHSSNGVTVYSSPVTAPVSLGGQSFPWCSSGQQVQYQDQHPDVYGQYQTLATPLPPSHFNSPATTCAVIQEMNNGITHWLPSSSSNSAPLQPSIRCFIDDTKAKSTSEASSWSDDPTVGPGPWETTQY